MKKLFQKIIYLLGIILFASSCGNNEDDPVPVDCSLNPITITSSTTAENCGASDGVLELKGSGGQGDFSFSIDGGSSFQTTGVFSNLTSATYSVVVRDSNDCESTSSIVLNNVGGITISIDNTVNSMCGTSEGQIITSSTGGTNIQFKLDDGSLQSSGTFTGLATGTYTVHAVEVSTGCSTSAEATILSGVSFAATIQNIITTKCAISGCHNGDNGSSRNWTVFANVQNNASNIKTRTQNRSMPQTGSLTQEQIDLIACWVDDGAMNN